MVRSPTIYREGTKDRISVDKMYARSSLVVFDSGLGRNYPPENEDHEFKGVERFMVAAWGSKKYQAPLASLREWTNLVGFKSYSSMKAFISRTFESYNWQCNGG